MMRGMITRVNKIERTQSIHGPGCIWRGDDEDVEAAQQRYLEQWPKDTGEEIVVLSWGHPP